VVPEGFTPHKALTKFGNETGLLDEPRPHRLPNGVDFWWDEEPTSDDNCWPDNTGPDGTRGSLTADPPINPLADSGCAKPYADGFRLHVMYARAAAFKPLREIAEGEAD
jgi:hypothetical protein